MTSYIESKQEFFYQCQDQLQNSAYFVKNIFIFEGEIDCITLGLAVQALLKKFEILNYLPHCINEKIKYKKTDDISIIDANIEVYKNCKEAISNLRKHDFSFSSEYPFKHKFCAAKIEQNKFAILTVFHHLYVDGHSIDLIYTYLESYFAGKATEEPSLDSNAEYTTNPAVDYVEDYKALFSGVEANKLKLNNINTVQGKVIRRELEYSDNAYLKSIDFSNKNSITDSHLALTAFAITQFALVSDQVLIAIPFMNRDAITESLVAPLVSTLVLYIDLSIESSVKSISEIIMNKLYSMVDLSTYDHHTLIDYFSNNLRKQIAIPTSFYVYQNIGTEFSDRIYSVPAQYVRSPLTLQVTKNKDMVQFQFEFSSSWFSNKSADEFLETFERVYSNIIKNGFEQRLDVCYLSESVMQNQLDAIQSSYSNRNSSLVSTILNNNRDDNDVIIIDCNEKEYTKRHLITDIENYSNYLLGMDVLQGDYISVSLKKSYEYVVAALSIINIGSVVVPINCELPSNRIKTIYEDVGVRWHIGDLPEGATNNNLSILDRPNKYQRRRTSQLITHCFYNTCYVIFTSGTTGTPKGVKMTQNGIARITKWYLDNRFTECNALSYSSIYWDAVLWELFAPLAAGCTVYLADEQLLDVEELSDLVNRKNIHLAFFTAGYSEQFRESHLFKMRGLKLFATGGDVVSNAAYSRIFKSLRETTVVNAYGPTECSTCTSTYIVKAFDIEKKLTIPIGNPLANTAAIVCSKAGQLLFNGRKGQLVVLGDAVTNGYFKDDKGQAFFNFEVPNCKKYYAYSTGDICYIIRDNLYFVGREDNLVKVRNYRINIDEVSDAIIDVDGVRNCKVKVVGENESKKICAWIICDRKISVERIRGELKKVLPKYSIPSVFTLIDEYPLTINGKVDYKKLVENLQSSVEKIKKTGNENRLDKIVLEVFRRYLDNYDFENTDDFFLNGGDSIIAMKIASELKQKKIQISAVEILDLRTVKKLLNAKGLILDNLQEEPLTLEDVEYNLFQREIRELLCEKINLFIIERLYKLKRNILPELLTIALNNVIQRHPIFQYELGKDKYIMSNIDDRNVIMTTLTVYKENSNDELKSLVSQFKSKFLSTSKLPFGFATIINKYNDDQWIYLIFNHFYVDDISIAILLSELSEVIYSSEKGQISLGVESNDYYLSWLLKQNKYAIKGQDRIFNNAGKAIAKSETETIILKLDSSISIALENAKKKTGIDFQSFLLAGFSRYLSKLYSESPDYILVESNGRAYDSELDLTQSVGWFTSVFPLKIKSSNVDILPLEIKERWVAASIGNSNTKYSYNKGKSPIINFNYLPKDKIDKKRGLFSELEFDFYINDREPQKLRNIGLELVISHDNEIVLHWNFITETEIWRLLKDKIEYYQSCLYEVLNLSKHSYAEKISASPIQEQILFSRAEKNTTKYITQWRCKLKGIVNTKTLRDSIRKVLLNNPGLRVNFSQNTNGSYDQVIQKDYNIPYQKFCENDLDCTVEKWLQSERENDFLFTNSCLLIRFTSISSDNHTHFIITAHHSIIDGWSLSNLISQLTNLYLGKIEGIVRTTDEEYISAFVNKQIQQELKTNRKIFEEKNDNEFSCRMSIQKKHGSNEMGKDKLSNLLPHSDLENIKQFAHQYSITESTIFLAAWIKLIKEYSNSRIVSTGYIDSGRSGFTDGKQDIIGCIIQNSNLLVGKFDLPCCEFVRALSKLQHYIIDPINVDLSDGFLEELQHSNPDYLFVYENYPADETDYQVMGLEIIEKNTEEYSGIPLCIAVKLGVETEIEFEFEKNEFFKIDVQVLARQYLCTIRNILNNANKLISEISIEDDQYEKRQLKKWSGNIIEVKTEDHPLKRIIENIINHPNRIAVVYKGDKLSYGDLGLLSDKIAHCLKKLDIEAGSRVAVSTTRCLEMIPAIVGIWKAGYVFVPISHKGPVERIRSIFEDASCKALLTRSDLKDPLPHEISNVIHIDKLEYTPRTIEVSYGLEAECYVYFTSGSTGKPKGVSVSFYSLAHVMIANEHAYNISSNSKSILQMANMSFDVFLGDLGRALCYGGKLVLVPQEFLMEPCNLFALANEQSCTFGEFIPIVLRNLINYMISSNKKLNTFKILTCGGEKWKGDDYNKIIDLTSSDCLIANGYGVTEVTNDSLFYIGRTKLSQEQTVPLDKCMSGQIALIQNADERICPINVIGELVILGKAVANGYINCNSGAFFFKNIGGEIIKAYHTGDSATYKPNGQIEIIGRQDNQLKIRGMRLEADEIEKKILNYKDTKDVLVTLIDVHGNIDDKALIAYYISDEVYNTSLLKKYLSESLPWFMIPDYFYCLTKWPLNDNGKVDRKKLPLPNQKRPELADSFINASTDLQQSLQMIWQRVLNIGRVGIIDRFVDIGGNSMKAMKMAHVISEKLNVDFSIREVLLYPTILLQEEQIERKRNDKENNLE